MAKSFTHLHVHTEYSMLDGASRIGDVVAAAAADGQPAIGITDHGNMYGVLPMYRAARDEFGDKAWVMSRDEVLDDGWLGPGPIPVSSRRRLGDVALLAREPVGFIDPAMPRERQLVGAHGSLTAAEMLVPLVAASGRG